MCTGTQSHNGDGFSSYSETYLEYIIRSHKYTHKKYISDGSFHELKSETNVVKSNVFCSNVTLYFMLDYHNSNLMYMFV